MSLRRRLSIGLVVSALPMALAAPPTQAAPPGAEFDRTYTCSNGRSYDVFVTDHGLAAFVDGRAVVARGFEFRSDFTLVVQNGPFAGDVVTGTVDSGLIGPSGKPANDPALTGTSMCVSTFSGPLEFVLGQETGEVTTSRHAYSNTGPAIDPTYTGYLLSGTQTGSVTLYVPSQQLERG